MDKNQLNLQANNQSRPALLTKNFVCVCLCNLLISVCSVMSMTTVLMYGNSLGLSGSISGLLVAIFAIFTTIGRPFSGILADRVPQKQLLLVAIVIFSIFPLGFVFSKNLWVMFICRAVQGLAMSFVSTVCSTISTGIIPKERFTEGIGYYGLGVSISTTISPAIGLFTISTFGYSGMFISMTIMGTIGLLSAALLQINHLQVPTIKVKAKRVNILKGMFASESMLPAGLHFFTSAVQISVVQFLPMFALSSGITDVSKFYVFSAIGVLLPKLAGRAITQTVGNKGLLAGSYILLGTSFGAICILDLGGATLLVVAFVYGMGISGVQMATQAWALCKVDDTRRGVANATFLFAADLSFSISPILWGTYQDSFGLSGMYVISLIIVGINSLVAFTRYKKES